jgi:hypothetical protein
MRPGLTLSGILLVATLGQGLLAQGLEDRRVGVFAEYTFADAQDPSYLHSRLAFNGGGVGFYVAQTRWLRWTGDFTFGGGILGPTIVYGFAGPEFTWRTGRATFFGHALFGYGEVDGGLFSFSDDKGGFAMASGGGVDLKLNARFNLRVVQLDYLPSRFGGRAESIFGTAGPLVTSWDNNLRVSTGIVLKFGHNP